MLKMKHVTCFIVLLCLSYIHAVLYSVIFCPVGQISVYAVLLLYMFPPIDSADNFTDLKQNTMQKTFGVLILLW